MKISAILLAAVSYALNSVIAVAATTPAITAFEATFAKVNDYTVTVTAHEVKGDRTQDRVYHYAFKRPNMAKADIVSGEGAGNGGVWRGGNTVKGHLRIAFFTVGKTVDLHDRRATSLRGYTIPEGLLQNEVAKFKEIKGQLKQHDGPQIDGVATDEVDLRINDPASNDNITRAVLYLSKATHFPVRQQRYEGNTMVADELFTDLKTNIGLTADF